MTTRSLGKLHIDVQSNEKECLCTKLCSLPQHLRDYTVDNVNPLQELLAASGTTFGFDSQIIVTLLSGGGIAAITSLIQALIVRKKNIKITFEYEGTKISFEGGTLEEFQAFMDHAKGVVLTGTTNKRR